MIGRVHYIEIDNFDAMGWKAMFTVKIEAAALVIEFKIEWRIPNDFTIEDGKLETKGGYKVVSLGSAFGLPWSKVTPYPVPDEPTAEIFSQN